jgi:N-acetylneuraminate synthase
MIGDNHPPVVIAEIGINHEGSLDSAIALADAAIDSGAEIVKHQTHIVEDEMSMEAKQIIPANADVSIYELIKRCALSENDEYILMRHVQRRGAIFISTPFSRAAVNRLVKFDVPAFKIGSGECNNYPLVKYIASFGKPIILSTGMNTIETIRPSVEILRNAKVPFALLHCTNIYPTPPELVRLGALKILGDAFQDAVLGLSDHTTSNYTCLGAVALGASILERHFTDSMDRPGPDVSSSMDPNSLKSLIEGSKIIFSARGGVKAPIEEEASTIAFAFASVVTTQNIKRGEILGPENIWVRRPSGGDFNVLDYESLFGKTASRDLQGGYQLKIADVL